MTHALDANSFLLFQFSGNVYVFLFKWQAQNNKEHVIYRPIFLIRWMNDIFGSHWTDSISGSRSKSFIWNWSFGQKHKKHLILFFCHYFGQSIFSHVHRTFFLYPHLKYIWLIEPIENGLPRTQSITRPNKR